MISLGLLNEQPGFPIVIGAIMIPDPHQRLSDVQHSGIEIEIPPPQSEYLPSSQPCAKFEKQRREQQILFHGGQELIDLFKGQWLHLACLPGWERRRLAHIPRDELIFHGLLESTMQDRVEIAHGTWREPRLTFIIIEALDMIRP